MLISRVVLHPRSLVLALALSGIACAADAGAPHEDVAATSAALDAVPAFGTNPGNLQMFRYVPQGAPPKAPLVVVLHGCTQGAADIAAAGWNALADQYKFYVAYPQQQTANNSAQCFNWFGGFNHPDDKTNVTRDRGEDLSIKQMVDKMKTDYSIDDARVFVAGFSAGGAMTAVLLATYPDVFAAGAIDAGIPYGCPATTNSDVFMCMNPGKTQTADQWGQAAKAGDPGWAGPWPRVSIWQGTQDYTVAVANEGELVKQWTNVHGLAATPTSSNTVQSYPHDVYADGTGKVLVERYAITGMGHGMAVDPSHGCGTASQYLPDEHICTASYMLQFFGIGAGAPPAIGTDAGSTGPGAGGDAGSGGGRGAPPPATGCTQGATMGAAPPASAGAGDDGFDARGSAGCTLGRAHRGSGSVMLTGVLAAVAALGRRRRRRAR